jgi:dTMP kinase
MRGIFITLEGGEGTGKSTHSRGLLEWFRANNREAIATREPGGTPEAEAVRTLLVDGPTDRWTANAEALLNYAARDSHLNRVIRPALLRGAVVICDRFMDSTRAYQHYAGECSASLVDALEREIVGQTVPDLTFIFDLDPRIGLQRAKARADTQGDRYERKGLVFHQRIQEGFRQIADANPERCKLVDASQTVGEIANALQNQISVFMNG